MLLTELLHPEILAGLVDTCHQIDISAASAHPGVAVLGRELAHGTYLSSVHGVLCAEGFHRGLF